MAAEHNSGLAEDGSRQHLCAACPKVFGRRDHLKRHMGGHVENKAPKQRGRRPKDIEDEVQSIFIKQTWKFSFSGIHFMNWSYNKYYAF